MVPATICSWAFLRSKDSPVVGVGGGEAGRSGGSTVPVEESDEAVVVDASVGDGVVDSTSGGVMGLGPAALAIGIGVPAGLAELVCGAVVLLPPFPLFFLLPLFPEASATLARTSTESAKCLVLNFMFGYLSCLGCSTG